jgi:hypothetical protein
MNQLAPISASHAPALVAAVGERASYRFLELFTAQIRNPHTRRAYARAATGFFDWLEGKGITKVTAIESVHVATYIEQHAGHCVRVRGRTLLDRRKADVGRRGGSTGPGRGF